MKSKKSLFESSRGVLLFASLCTLLWGSAYPSIKVGYGFFNIAQNDIGSKFLFAGYRFMMAGILVQVFSFVLYKKFLVLKRKDLFLVSQLGLVQTTFQYVFFYIGLSYATGAKSAILNSFISFGCVLIAPLIYKDEKLTVKKGIGCILGFFGIVVINMDGGSLGGFHLFGDGSIILADIFAIWGYFLSKKVTRQTDAMTATSYQLFIGGIVLIAGGFMSGGSINLLNAQGTLLLVYMAFLSAAAFTLWTKLLAVNPVGEVSIYNLLVPLFGTVLSGIFLGENIVTFVNLVSVILVCTGIGTVNHKSTKKGVLAWNNSKT